MNYRTGQTALPDLQNGADRGHVGDLVDLAQHATASGAAGTTPTRPAAR